MKILAIDTSCDETSVAVTKGVTVLSNIIWSQASQHAQFGGVLPSLAQRAHEERIDWVVDKALTNAHCSMSDIGCIAVTTGPGLAIALGVGIKKAKELGGKYNKPVLAVNHIEGHLLSSMAKPRTVMRESEIDMQNITFPALGLIVSGKHTDLVYVEKIGKYKIIAQTLDDALGEALDKAARMLGLGYPGGAIMEKLARVGNIMAYPLPLPMIGRENLNSYSYSGLKAAFHRLIAANAEITKNRQQVCDLAAVFQNRAFEHLIRVTTKSIKSGNYAGVKHLLVGGGVIANTELRKRLRRLGKEYNLKVKFPHSNKLIGDNAAMIGVAAGFKVINSQIVSEPIESIDRRPRWKIDEL